MRKILCKFGVHQVDGEILNSQVEIWKTLKGIKYQRLAITYRCSDCGGIKTRWQSIP